ncbi:MAG: glycerophosphodiester phosphodiesterase [Microlunatus sp.]|nr:glycerophosphodiester phosphodiesterase [Microlunatus sp.]
MPSPRRIQVAGHRGAMAHAPENTALSLVMAEQLGVDEIELDVRVSADGVAVLSRDDDLSRVLGVDVAPTVSVTAWCDLQNLRLPRGQRLLTLPEALELTRSNLQLELKSPQAVPIAAQVLADFADEVRRCSFTSFDVSRLIMARELLPDVPRGVIADAYDPTLAARARAAQAAWIYSGWNGLTPDVIAALHQQGCRIGVWPLCTAEDAERAYRLGVDKITADAPGEAREWLEAAEADLGARP